MLYRHSLIYLVARGIPAIIGFFTIILYTRLLSPNSFGQYSLIVSAAMLLNAILYHWLNASLVRFLPKYRDTERDFMSTILSGFIIVSFLAGACFVPLWYISRGSVWSSLIILGFLLVLAQAWFTINLELIRSRLAPIQYGVISSAKSIIALLVGVVLVLFGFEVYGALLGLVFGYLASSAWASRGKWSLFPHYRLDRECVATMLAYGLPLTLSFALAAIISNSDRLMLTWLIDESATGLYAAGQGIVQQAIGVLMSMVHLAAYPLIVQALDRGDADESALRIRKNMILLLGIGLPLATVFGLLAEDFAYIFLGDKFQQAAIELMPLFAISTLVASMRAYHFDLAFYLGRRTGVQVYVIGSAALLNILLNLWFIPTFGLAGAAYSSIAAHGVACVLSAVLGRRSFPMPVTYPDVIRILMATLMLAILLFIMPSNKGVLGLIIPLVLGGMVYLVALIALNVGGSRMVALKSCAHIGNFLKNDR